MAGGKRADPTGALLGALADEIAERLASRIAPQLAEIIGTGGLEAAARVTTSGELRTVAAADAGGGMWTAARVAAHYQVAVRFVYQHADALGCVRLGAGCRPRLRFDPNVVRERWALVGDVLPATAPRRKRSPRRTKRQHDSERRPYELMDYEERP